MKIKKAVFAIALAAAVTMPTAASATALPAQVARGEFYDHYQHWWGVLFNSGFCSQSHQSGSGFCLYGF